ncbi:MAG TPA: DUF1731 domain-containing protein [Terriglobia bacterium]|nr:DUF1731 domain-containing protein [Terriglobia bacterium]
MPGFAASLVFGEKADELLLASVRVAPAKLEALGFVFRHTNLNSLYRACLEYRKRRRRARAGVDHNMILLA